MIISILLGGGYVPPFSPIHPPLILLPNRLTYVNLTATTTTVYTWFSSLVAISGFIQWALIYITHIHFHHGLASQSIGTQNLPFRDRTAPYGQYLGLLIVFAILAAEFSLALWPIGAGAGMERGFAGGSRVIWRRRFGWWIFWCIRYILFFLLLIWMHV